MESMGVARGCGGKEVYSFLILLILTPLVHICSFWQQFKKVFALYDIHWAICKESSSIYEAYFTRQTT